MPAQKPRLVNLDLDLLRAFVAVAESQSFTRAGARLGRTQSTISLQIKRLEESVNAELFSRDPRNVTLTGHGEALLVQARRLLRLNDEIIGEMFEHSLEGEVRFGAPEDFATTHLPGILGDYARAYPHVSLQVTCDLTLRLMDKLSQGELDLALIKREPMGADGGVPVWREELVWVGAGEDVLPAAAPAPLIVAPAPCVYRKRATSALDKANRPWRIAYTSPSLAGQQAALRAGLGVTALPTEMVPADLVKFGPEQGFPALADVEIALMRAGKSLPVAAERLANFILASLNASRLQS
ncbi:LysR family transcriptional regulator [Candidatus Viadribacter manganicus]|uniref:LysR family transcriptional regulator n=2 Tax=Candidatus Viadribacter manganicus TaxID=1759059 RepID=A0A1B1AN33_9PROT|nr:LysR family transcriptional regulator [Candidatus Viadribacter manganicus]